MASMCMEVHGDRIGLTWPGRLPEPRLSGPPDVRPGVDLVIKAMPPPVDVGAPAHGSGRAQRSR